MESLSKTLHALEMRLMDPEVRRNGTASDLIAEDFAEFGGNGRIYNKNDALAMMRLHSPRVYALEEFAVRMLGSQVALVTYRLQSEAVEGGPGRMSARSSIWVQRNEKWQVTFHQVTMLSIASAVGGP